MQHQIYHVVVDTNVLAAHFIPDSVHSQRLRDRAQSIFHCAMHTGCNHLRIHTPSICIAEVFHVIDKYRHCDWHGPVKKDSSKRLSKKKYIEAINRLQDALKQGVIRETSDTQSHHNYARLISPINARYQFRRGKNITGPMSASDTIVIGASIHIGQVYAGDSVSTLSNDKRLCDISSRARAITLSSANELILPDIASEYGIAWSAKIYPKAIYLQDANMGDLRGALGNWPLPAVVVASVSWDDLDADDIKVVKKSYETIKKRHGLPSTDRLPYSKAIDELRLEIAAKNGKLLRCSELLGGLLRLRKSGALSGAK